MPVAAGIALLLYLLLAQRALHGLDVQTLVHKVATGDLDHPYHYMYLHIVSIVVDVLQWFSVSVFDATVVASAVGTAVGCLCLSHAASRLAPVLRIRVDPVWALILVGTSPAVVFFATISEIHGVFFAFSGLAWLAAAGLATKTTWMRALMVGAATGVASCVHATGHLQWMLIVLCLWAWLGWRKLVIPVLVSGICHALVAMLLAAWLRGDQMLAGQSGFLLRSLPDPADSWLLGFTFFSEWLLPFAPLSVLCFFAARQPRHRPQVWALGLALLVYLLASFVMLQRTTERGAYLLPLAFPAALLTMQTFHTRVLGVAASVGLALAVVMVWHHDRQTGPDDFGAGVAVAHAKAPVTLVCSGREEVDPLTRMAPTVQRWTLYDLVEPTRSWIKDDMEFTAFMDAVIRDLHARGKRFVISDGARRMVEEGGNPRLLSWLQGAADAGFEQLRIVEGGFSGTVFVPW